MSVEGGGNWGEKKGVGKKNDGTKCVRGGIEKRGTPNKKNNVSKYVF